MKTKVWIVFYYYEENIFKSVAKETSPWHNYFMEELRMFTTEGYKEIIQASHIRCREEYGVPIDRIFPTRIIQGKEFMDLLKENCELIKVAKPFMKILYDFLKGSGFFIDLTDKDGIILSVIGDRDVIDIAEAMGMMEGTDMSEESTGTNAIGTALKEDCPIQMAEKDHYIKAYHIWTCSACTIHSEEGNIIGCLNLTGKYQLVHPHTLGLVVAAVKSIENHIKKERSQNELFEAYQYLNTIVNSIDTGILTVNIYGIIKSINNIACTMLEVSSEDIIETNIVNILENWTYIYDEISNGNEYENKEISFNILDKKKRVNLNAYAIRDKHGVITGMALVIKDIQKVYDMVNKYSGMRARYTFQDIIGESEKMVNLRYYAKSIANSPSTVLIQGESGTGKELIAQSIHNSSDRKDYGFVAINCGAIPKNLIESELFGYEEGAFTGARKGGHPGKFELANNGTIFLDEIGEMPLDMQVNLLRVLQEGYVTRIGGRKYIPVDVRVIAATNKNLIEEIEKGTFREDLYYRLSVIPIFVPPLRERTGDVPILLEHFLRLKSLKLKKPMLKLKDELYYKLVSYDWPGNIRELENCIENIVNMDGNISFSFNNRVMEVVKQGNESTLKYNMCSLEEWEKMAILSCIENCQGNLSKASKILEINRTTLYNKINRYNIKL